VKDVAFAELRHYFATFLGLAIEFSVRFDKNGKKNILFYFVAEESLQLFFRSVEDECLFSFRHAPSSLEGLRGGPSKNFF